MPPGTVRCDLTGVGEGQKVQLPDDSPSGNGIAMEKRIAEDLYYWDRPTVTATSTAMKLAGLAGVRVPYRDATLNFLNDCYSDDGGYRLGPKIDRRVRFFYTYSGIQLLQCLFLQQTGNAESTLASAPAREAFEHFGQSDRLNVIQKSTTESVMRILSEKTSDSTIQDLYHGLLILQKVARDPRDSQETASLARKYILDCYQDTGAPQVRVALFLSPKNASHCLSAYFFAARIARHLEIHSELKFLWKSAAEYVVACWDEQSGGYQLQPTETSEGLTPSILATYFGMDCLKNLQEFGIEIDNPRNAKHGILRFLRSCKIDRGYAIRPHDEFANVFATYFFVKIKRLLGGFGPFGTNSLVRKLLAELYDESSGGYRGLTGSFAEDQRGRYKRPADELERPQLEEMAAALAWWRANRSSFARNHGGEFVGIPVGVKSEDEIVLADDRDTVKTKARALGRRLVYIERISSPDDPIEIF